MNICLIFPPNIYQTKQSMPPLGIAWLAAVLRENGFPNVFLIDSIANRYTNEQIIEILKKQDPDIIGISFGTQIRFSSFDLAREIKKHFPDVPLAAGGPHPTLCPEDTLKGVPEIDIICRGEGERVFLNLARNISQRSDLRDVKGISFHNKEGQIFHNAPEEYIKDLDNLPLPARDLLQLEKYEQTTFLSKKRSTSIMSSRGCPYRCVYCSVSKQWGHFIRHRSPKNVVDEIEFLLKTYAFLGGIRFFDDVFTMDKNRVLEICSEIERRKLKFAWECEARANTIDKEMVLAMKRAGCEFIDLGVESGSDRVLKRIKKAITVEMVIEAAKTIKSAGIDMKAFMMHSLPGERCEDVKKTIFLSRYLYHKLKIKGATQSITLIYPGTELERIAKEQGTLPADFSWSKYYERERSYPPLSDCIYMPIFEQPDFTYEQVFECVRKAKIAYFLRHPIHLFSVLWKHHHTIKQWLFTKTKP